MTKRSKPKHPKFIKYTDSYKNTYQEPDDFTKKINFTNWSKASIEETPLVHKLSLDKELPFFDKRSASNKAALRYIEQKRRELEKRNTLIADMMLLQGQLCWYCGLKLKPNSQKAHNPITIEHIIPISNGGNSHRSNLVLAHMRCNTTAGAKLFCEKWRLRCDMRRGFIEIPGFKYPKR